MPRLRVIPLICLLCAPVFALNPDVRVSQYAHTAWRIQDGFFTSSPYAVAQTTDGFIWVGTASGIVRFDGVRFVPLNPPNGGNLLTSNILALAGSSDGGLWIGTDRNGLWKWKAGQMEHFALSGLVTSINVNRENGKDSVWAVSAKARGEAGSVCEVVRGQLYCYGVSNGIPPGCCNVLTTDINGIFWIGTRDEIIRWTPRASTSDVSPFPESAVSSIAIFKDGSMWMGLAFPGGRTGLQHLVHGAWRSFATAEWNGHGVGVLALLRDSNNTLWVGTKGHGLYRLFNGKVDHFGNGEGLSGDTVTQIIEDREGNLWVTTPQGIDCFRDVAVSTFSSKQGLSALSADTVMASRNGAVWAGGEYSLDTLTKNGFSSLRTGEGLPGVQVTSLLEDHLGRLWVGVDQTMSLLRDGKFAQIRRSDGRPLGFVVGMAEDSDNNVWAEVSGTPRELLRIRDLQVDRVFTTAEIPAARKIAADPGGGIWLGLMSGDLARYQQGKLEVYHFQHEVDSYVNQINVNPDGSVLGATAFGLVGFRNGKQQILTVRNGLPCNSINAFVWDRDGALWLYTQCGLIEIAGQEIQRWWTDESAILTLRVFDASDGAQAGLAWFQGASLAMDGKLWFANNAVFQMIDPLHLPVNAISPPVHVEEVTANGHTFKPTDGQRFSALTRDVAIRYTALSFVAPQKVRFRYMLEGQDTTWQEAGSRREAFYTNLAPANYRFRVIACNNSGLWNQVGATWSFQIAPAYYQTSWFKLLCVGVGLLFVWRFYLLRLNQATAQIQARLSERLRIARELHDTLLQGFSGLVLRFAAASKALPATEPARELMEKALDRADEVLQEGRLRVRNLRSEATAMKDLGESLLDCGEELAQASGVSFKLTVVGESQPLDPAGSDDVYRIGREALINAFSHAQSSSIEVELTYDRAKVRLRVRDNGIGIDPNILKQGRPGHWGLSGIRERAEQIGAKLNIWSSLGAGTEIDLTIPAKAAYSRGPKVDAWFRLQRIFGGGRAR